MHTPSHQSAAVSETYADDADHANRRFVVHPHTEPAPMSTHTSYRIKSRGEPERIEPSEVTLRIAPAKPRAQSAEQASTGAPCAPTPEALADTIDYLSEGVYEAGLAALAIGARGITDVYRIERFVLDKAFASARRRENNGTPRPTTSAVRVTHQGRENGEEVFTIEANTPRKPATATLRVPGFVAGNDTEALRAALTMALDRACTDYPAIAPHEPLLRIGAETCPPIYTVARKRIAMVLRCVALVDAADQARWRIPKSDVAHHLRARAVCAIVARNWRHATRCYARSLAEETVRGTNSAPTAQSSPSISRQHERNPRQPTEVNTTIILFPDMPRSRRANDATRESSIESEVAQANQTAYGWAPRTAYLDVHGTSRQITTAHKSDGGWTVTTLCGCRLDMEQNTKVYTLPIESSE